MVPCLQETAPPRAWSACPQEGAEPSARDGSATIAKHSSHNIECLRVRPGSSYGAVRLSLFNATRKTQRSLRGLRST